MTGRKAPLVLFKNSHSARPPDRAQRRNLMKNAKLIFLQLFCGGIVVFCSPVFAVSGLHLDKSENPLFSCLAVYLNDSHIRTGGRIGNMCSGEFIGKKQVFDGGAL